MNEFTTQQSVFLIVTFVFSVAVIIANGLRAEKEQSRKRWKEMFKDKPYDDPSRVALRLAGYPVD